MAAERTLSVTMTTAELVTSVISVTSLIVAGLALYRAELRGPKVSLRMLQGPSQWDSLTIEYANLTDDYGHPEPVPRGKVDELQSVTITLGGECLASLDNDGPKEGTIWDVRGSVEHLPSLWNAQIGTDLPRMQAVGEKASTPVAVTVSLCAQSVKLAAALAEFDRDHQPMLLHIEYMARRGILGSPGKGKASLALDSQPVRDYLASWAAKRQS
jgi:hypothetical protein